MGTPRVDMTSPKTVKTWNAALDAYNEGKAESSLTLFNTINGSAKVLINIGLIYAGRGSHASAIAYFRRANECDPYFALSHFQRGVSNFHLGRFELAFQSFEEALRHLRHNVLINYAQLGLRFKLYAAEILFNMGIAQIRNGWEGDGMEILRRARSRRMTEEHSVIEDAIRDNGEGYSVFSIPTGVLFQPPNDTTSRNVFDRGRYSRRSSSMQYLSSTRSFIEDAPILPLQPPATQEPSKSKLSLRITTVFENTRTRESEASRSSAASEAPQRQSARSRTTKDLRSLFGIRTTRSSPSKENDTEPPGIRPDSISSPMRSAEGSQLDALLMDIYDSYAAKPATDSAASPQARSRSVPPTARRPPRLRSPSPEDSGTEYSPTLIGHEDIKKMGDFVFPSLPLPPLPWQEVNSRSRPPTPIRTESHMDQDPPPLKRAATVPHSTTDSVSSFADAMNKEKYPTMTSTRHLRQGSTGKIHIRLFFLSEVRGLVLSPDASFAEFQQRVVNKFGRPPGSISFKFVDEEGSTISICDESDYDLAISKIRTNARRGLEAKMDVTCAPTRNLRSVKSAGNVRALTVRSLFPSR